MFTIEQKQAWLDSHILIYSKMPATLKTTIAGSTQINQDIVDSVDVTTRNPF